MIGWLPAPTTRSAELRTPQPAYAPVTFRDTVRPELIPANQRIRAMAAARHALLTFPGPAGEILAVEIKSYVDLGWLARRDSPVQRLIDQLMTEPPAPNIQ